MFTLLNRLTFAIQDYAIDCATARMKSEQIDNSMIVSLDDDPICMNDDPAAEDIDRWNDDGGSNA